jgi:hypothetical protein
MRRLRDAPQDEGLSKPPYADLILRSRAQRGVSKDGRGRNLIEMAAACWRPEGMHDAARGAN